MLSIVSIRGDDILKINRNFQFYIYTFSPIRNSSIPIRINFPTYSNLNLGVNIVCLIETFHSSSVQGFLNSCTHTILTLIYESTTYHKCDTHVVVVVWVFLHLRQIAHLPN